MKSNYWQPLLTGILLSIVLGLSLPTYAVESEDSAQQEEPQKGPHNGRLLIEGEFVVELAIFEDRKSTRLNSSHANISYAVCCLKKNKEIRQHHRKHESPLDI